MTTTTIADYLKFASLQVAAEAFLNNVETGEKLYSGSDLTKALITGNNHVSVFPASEASKFVADWRVIDQRANTQTGFSGTLFEHTKTRELVLSFRSTEFIDDAIRDSAATNSLEVFKTGWAWGQIADMEAWYKELTGEHGALLGKTYSVTGYSLGGHLATAFNLLRHEDAAQATPPATLDQVVTFNATGVFNTTLEALAQAAYPALADDPGSAAQLADYNLISSAVARIKPVKTVLALLMGAFIGTQAFADTPQREATKLRMTEGKALFEEKCKTVAGERIYKTVPEVEGLLLMKIRPRSGEREQSDPMWPGAAFAREATGDEYIMTFLAREYGGETLDGTPTPITPVYRGSVGWGPNKAGSRPGYRWVEVLDERDGKRYRYTGAEKAVRRMDVNARGVQMALAKNPGMDLNVYQWTLDKVPASGPSPRYGVTFEDHIIPEERQRGLASSTVKVLDLKTGEVLGEMLRYAWSPGATSPANPAPWLTAYKCPGHARGADAASRKFVDQILIPKKDQ